MGCLNIKFCLRPKKLFAHRKGVGANVYNIVVFFKYTRIV